MSKFKDITGMRFGRLVALEPTDERQHGSVVWKCRCDCGNEKLISLNTLKFTTVKSCGCLLKQVYKLPQVQYARGQVDGTFLTMLNNKPTLANTSGTRGVYWNKEKKKFHARITFKNKTYCLGYYDKKEDAAKARKQAEEEIWQPFIEERYKGPELK